MLKFRIVLLFVFLFTLFVISDTSAFDLKKGTISMGGGSSFSFGNRDSENSSSRNNIVASFTSGYFIVDNLEIGGELSAHYSKSDYLKGKDFTISPFVTYHFDLNEVSNIFITGMIGFGKYNYDSDYSSDETNRTIFSAEAGWEYFFNQSVSTTIGFKYSREKYDNDEYNHTYTYNSFDTIVGFKIYF